MKRPLNLQNGAVLVISLLMLIVLTLLAVSAINSSSIDLRITDNVQVQQGAEAAAMQAINDSLSDVNNFTSPAAQTVTANGYSVQMAAAQCTGAAPASGYSAVWGLAPEDTEWKLTATINDAATGAQVKMVQGVGLRMTAGSCP